MKTYAAPAVAISVVICTRNPRADYIARVLGALAGQTFESGRWELLIIDNGSIPPLCESIDLSWHRNATIVPVQKAGKVFALVEAIERATGELILIVDDDNILRCDYIQVTVDIGISRRWLGAWAGSCIPEFEIEPPTKLEPHLAGLVIEKIERPFFSNIPDARQALPPGAGMTVRTSIAQYWAKLIKSDAMRQKFGHSGGKVGAGEDADMALCSLHFDLAVGRFPELELIHLIPARKLSISYLRRLHYTQSHAATVLDYMHNRSGAYRSSAAYAMVKHLIIFCAGLIQIRSVIEFLFHWEIFVGKLAAVRDLRKSKKNGTPL